MNDKINPRNRDVHMNRKEMEYVRQEGNEIANIKIKTSVVQWLKIQNESEERFKYTTWLIEKKVDQVIGT